jgi:methanogenic corrinoid protein MtbC1
MNLDNYITLYNEAIFDTDLHRALKVVRDAVDQGVTPEEVVFQIVVPAMDLMVRSVSENFDANLAQHFLTARIADEVTAEMIPKFRNLEKGIGRVVIGTAWGDFHTLGKRLVIGCLKARMIDVIDLGINVMAERFVDEAVSREAPIIAISALMVHTATGDNGCRKVRKILQERNLETKIKVIIGGAPFRFSPQLFKTVGADTTAPDAISASKVMEDLLKEARR